MGSISRSLVTASRVTLSLAELEAQDPTARSGGRERRFTCPSCGGDKKQDAAHRCLAVNTSTGAWHCHRCGEHGLLREFQTICSSSSRFGRPHPCPPLAKGRAGVGCLLGKGRGAVLPPIPPAPNADMGADYLAIGENSFDTLPLSSPAAHAARAYLTGRGIAPDPVALRAGVRYCPNWQGRRPAVVFPVQDEQGRFLAAQGRYIDSKSSTGCILPNGGTLKTTSAGPISQGVFATPGAFPAKPDGRIILTEAPIDALSLDACGFPAVAFCGSGIMPAWVPARCAFQTVYLAFDADDAGDKAAEAWTKKLTPFTRDIARLRPEGGDAIRRDAPGARLKDWNQLLMRYGRSWLIDRVVKYRPVNEAACP